MYIKNLLERQQDNVKIAITQGDRTLSYQEWYKISQNLAKEIGAHLKSDNSNVAIFLPNSIDYAIAYFAITFNDKTIVPIGIQAKELEVCSTAKYCELDVFVSISSWASTLVEYFKDYEYRVEIFCIDNSQWIVVNETMPVIDKTKAEPLTEKSTAIMLHTSGSTYLPKRVMLTHYSLIYNVESNIDSLKLTENDVCLISIPMFFGYCNTAQFLTHIYLGASMVIMTGIFYPKEFLKVVEKEKVTNYTGVPSNLLMLLQYKYSDKYDFSSLRYICFGGGVMPIEGLKELITRFPSIGFVQTYGQTEASPRLTANLPEFSLLKIGSVGTPIKDVKIRVVDETNKDCVTNQVGEIIANGPNVMKGYYKNEEATKETIVDGWLHTGDLGYLDEDDFLYIVGRKKNIIISGGINIYPEEIEEVLLMNPNVKDVLVYGESDYLLGEVPVAEVVYADDAEEVDLTAYCMEKLAKYKVPTKFYIQEKLEKTYNGKIKRKYGNKGE